jgi:hypothetical protein
LAIEIDDCRPIVIADLTGESTADLTVDLIADLIADLIFIVRLTRV